MRGGSATFSNNILQGSGGSANWLADLGTDGGGNLDSDPKLGPLQDNGGPTQTMLPGVGGSAIDAYACTPLTPAADQRGVARPQSAQCDAGAVELGLYPLTVSLTGTGNVQLDTPPKGASTAPACPTDNCSALAYFESQLVTLTASPASPAGSAFTGWSGDACAGSTSPGCSVTVNAAKTVTATFSAFSVTAPSTLTTTYGTAYNQAASATGGAGTLSFSAPASTPAGLSVDSTGNISAANTLAAGTYTIDITATDSNGASTLPVSVNVTVNPAPLTITANNASMVYGQALPAFTVSYSGWVNGDTAASLNPPPAVTTTATAASPVGSYPITANGALNANYTIAYAPGTLTIGQAGQTLAITSTAPANAKVGGSYTVTTSGGGSTQPVVLSVSGDACSLAGSVVSFDTVGTCVITANQAGDGNFTAAQPVSQTVKVGQAASVITVESSHNPSLPGQEVTFSIAVVPDSTKSLQAQSSQAKAAPVPTGTVTLTDGATTLGTAPLDGSGKATLAVTSLTTPGAHNIVASYSGDASFPAAQSAVWIQTVNAASVSAPTPVPSLSNLALVLLSAMAAGFGGLALRLRRKTAQA
ncbi:MBG domain-containing protein [Comamonas sp. J-3]|uniref:MBG domain-containing protein n=1 Tax=Comamonas trifloxystrobinivorans TaxID=3350256 RepID=UPI00372CFB27